MIYVGDVHTGGLLSDILSDSAVVSVMHENIKTGDVYVVKSGIQKDLLEKVREYLISVARGSLPAYQSINFGAPNFHRMNRFDERAYVRGCFHQFSFFPWNDDIFDFFELFKDVYRLKNRLSLVPENKFLGKEPEDGCIARLSFQFYPCGGGMLNRHADPVDHHQLTVPTMMLSKKGEDFFKGGAFVENVNKERIYLDDVCDWGDVAFFNAKVVHGVECIDSKAQLNWHDFRGRWMALFAVNKLADNADISNSLDLDD